MSRAGTLERVLQRDRAIATVALALIALFSWVWVLLGAGMGMSAFEMSSLSIAFGAGVGGNSPMGGMDATSAMAMPVVWDAGYAMLMFFMWWIMMIAMMLPSAAPMILLHAKVARKGGGDVALGTSAFTFGYLASWAAFSVVAVGLQWTFSRAGVLSPMLLNATNAAFAGGILIFAGLYQLTPLKQACLRHCRSPIGYLSAHWRNGAGGALVMGLHHGVYCLGCCWGLMAILFFGGIMNLYWILGLAILVLLEKSARFGPRAGAALGALLVLWGGVIMAGALNA